MQGNYYAKMCGVYIYRSLPPSGDSRFPKLRCRFSDGFLSCWGSAYTCGAMKRQGGRTPANTPSPVSAALRSHTPITTHAEPRKKRLDKGSSERLYSTMFHAQPTGEQIMLTPDETIQVEAPLPHGEGLVRLSPQDYDRLQLRIQYWGEYRYSPTLTAAQRSHKRRLAQVAQTLSRETTLYLY